MKTVLRIYTWIAFPVIASLFILVCLLDFIYSILNGFTYTNFFKISLEEVEKADKDGKIKFLKENMGKKYIILENLIKIFSVFSEAVIRLFYNLKSLNSYKF